METIIFITGNKYKFKIAQKALNSLNVKLVQRKLEIPEIQSVNVEEIASFSAGWASKLLKKPVLLSDVGFYIESLKGFPGPFVKYINRWLFAEDYLKLMRGKKNRRVTVKDCLAYCEYNKKPITFCALTKGKIARRAGNKGISSMDKIFIPEGEKITTSEMKLDEMLNFWRKNINNWEKFINYLKPKRRFFDRMIKQ
jgi:non-canonical purine NTP pyrophosphatase (RdgB/HAM1 family)